MVFFDDKAATINDLIDAIEAIEHELGLTPAGVYASVRTRLDILEARINNPFAPAPNVENPFFIGNDGVTISTGFGFPTENRIPGSLYLREDGYNNQGLYSRRTDGYWHQVDTDPWTANGDLAGTIYTQTVIGIQNRPVSAAAPQTDSEGDGYVLTWNSTVPQWEPQIGFFAAGDLSGNKHTQTVIQLQGRPLSAAAPSDGYAITWNTTSAQWEPRHQAVVFDAVDSNTTTNIRSNRYITQSPLDNTKTGIVNLSSDTTQLTTGVTANYSSILGGDQNVVDGYYSSIVGGLTNTNHGQKSFIGGGFGNTVSGINSSIVGGNTNTITNEGNENFIGGGNTNIARGTQGFIGAGFNNNLQPNTVGAAIVAGANNIVLGTHSYGFVGTGNTNTAQVDYSSILNGQFNTVGGIYSTILDGYNNLVQDGYCFANGVNNVLLVGIHSFVHGASNHTNAIHSRVWGLSNTILGTGSTYGTIFGDNNTIGDLFSTTSHNTLIGHNNTVNTGSPFSTLLGDTNVVSDGYAFVNGLGNTVNAGGTYATIFGNNNVVTALAPHGTVFGTFGVARLPGQFTQSNFSYSGVAGSTQFSRMLLNGAGINGATIPLTLDGINNLTTENGKVYDMKIRIAVIDTVSAGTCARYLFDVLAHAESGSLVIDRVDAVTLNDNGTGWVGNNWVNIFSTSGLQLLATIPSSGANTRRAAATIEWTELTRL